MGKIAKDSEEAWKLQENYKDKPHGWIQWKGTEVCMDVYCKCGKMMHVDAMFVYNVECPYCGTVYMCSGFIELIEVKERPKNCVVLLEKREDD